MIIYLLALDIDGVFTDGTVTIIEDKEAKQIHYHDLDAVNIIQKKGINVVFITGEDNVFVDILAQRCNVEYILRGAKNKLKGLEKVCKDFHLNMNEICYVGDSDRDAEAIRNAGLGIAPPNGSPLAKSSADIVLKTPGGSGAIAEVVRILLDRNND